jgi:F0F1-type ATP synthase membrane subunit c/vacuolar-type H+-ATPase subunit K
MFGFRKLFLTVVFFLMGMSLFLPIRVICAESPSQAFRASLNDPDARSGHIISRNEANEYVRSSVLFDDRMVGVLADTAVIVYGDEADNKLIVTSGETPLFVSTLNGPIKAGDYLTSSPLPGVAQKSGSITGYMLGVALEDFNGENGTTVSFENTNASVGTIRTLVKIGPVVPKDQSAISDFVDRINMILFQNSQTNDRTMNLLRYLIAALLLLLSITICLFTFGRNINRGIEALGRNPLARRQIQISILVNTFLIVIIVLGAFILALAIIRF